MERLEQALGRRIRQAPDIGKRRPGDRLGRAGHVGAVVDLLHFRRVFDGEAVVRVDEIGEDIVAGTVAADAPFDRQPGALQSPAATQHRVEIGQLVGDVAQQELGRSEKAMAMMVGVAAHEARLAGSVAEPEVKHVAQE